jgi:hypothetical protein
MNKYQLIGSKFGDWTVISKTEDGKFSKAKWNCVCTCGKEKSVFETHLVRGNSSTCTNSGTHGIGKQTPGHTSYSSMMSRCHLPSHKAFHRYGGRGIKVCESWKKGFVNFHKDMGDRPEGMTLERIDLNGDYEPSNCKWASRQEQQNNTCTNKFVIRDGQSLTIAQLARKQGVHYETLYSRLKRAGEI